MNAAMATGLIKRRLLHAAVASLALLGGCSRGGGTIAAWPVDSGRLILEAHVLESLIADGETHQYVMLAFRANGERSGFARDRLWKYMVVLQLPKWFTFHGLLRAPAQFRGLLFDRALSRGGIPLRGTFAAEPSGSRPRAWFNLEIDDPNVTLQMSFPKVALQHSPDEFIAFLRKTPGWDAPEMQEWIRDLTEDAAVPVPPSRENRP